MYARRVVLWKVFLFLSLITLLLNSRLLHNFSRMSASTALHTKCRNSAYPLANGLQRVLVPDEYVDWRISWAAYQPINYTDPKVHGKSWADPDIRTSPEISLKFNALDGKVDRTSYMGLYQLNSEGLPLNPRGRTGITGRGSLGRWGPNHAADPIVTRWKTNLSGERVFDLASKRFVLQFVAIQRGDCGEWAFPGGMVDAGEKCTDSLRREFAEEALNSNESSPEELETLKKLIAEFFVDGTEIYKGYVDDPRNTDNAWMETIAVNFHDETGDRIAKFDLKAGDDAKKVRWMDVGSEINLYANHRDFLELVATRRNAKW